MRKQFCGIGAGLTAVIGLIYLVGLLAQRSQARLPAKDQSLVVSTPVQPACPTNQPTQIPSLSQYGAYLWPQKLPPGFFILRRASAVSDIGFTLTISGPISRTLAGGFMNQVIISGGTEFTKATTVTPQPTGKEEIRGNPVTEYCNENGCTILWSENGIPYRVQGFGIDRSDILYIAEGTGVATLSAWVDHLINVLDQP